METNKAVIRNMEDAFNRRDWPSFGAAFADEVKWQKFPLHATVTRTGYIATYQDIARTFPDWVTTIERLIAEGDWVVERVRVDGTHLARPNLPHHGDFRAAEPTQKKIAVWQAHFGACATG